MEPSAARSNPDSLATHGDLTRQHEPSTAPSGSYAASEELSGKSTALLSPSPSVPSKSPPFVPREFGPYQLVGELGRGGMGVVFEARHVVLERRLALKMIRPGRSGPDEVERFLREAKAIAQLKHRNIVTMYDFGQINGEYYFTMEIAERGSLLKHLERFAKNPRDAVALLAKAARVVQHVHDAGLMHRDLKPGNILLGADDEPILSDFGLAKPFTPSEDALTNTGVVPGTRAYMSPEQASGSNPACPQSDVWALGVILFEMICGRKPFTGESDEKITTAILKSDPPEPRSLQPAVDRGLEAIMLKCLQKEPARRYKTAGALADDLERWLRGEPTEAQPPSRLGRMVRRHRRVLIGAAVAAILAVVGVAVALQFDPDRVLKREIMPVLERGEKVVLLGETGKPTWSQWILPGHEILKDGESYGFHSGDVSMLELLPAVPTDRYVFRAEVRQARNSAGSLGVYCCRGRHRLSWGEMSDFFLVRFADWGPTVRKDSKSKKRTSDARANLCLQSRPLGFHFTRQLAHKEFVPWEELHQEPSVTSENEIEAIRQKIKEAEKKQESPDAFSKRRRLEQQKEWRKIRIEVTPEVVRWYWEGELVISVEKAQQLKLAATLTRHQELEGNQPEFPRRGGLGLFVDKSRASFRNVVVEPLKE